jgi:hypothetical protein
MSSTPGRAAVTTAGITSIRVHPAEVGAAIGSIGVIVRSLPASARIGGFGFVRTHVIRTRVTRFWVTRFWVTRVYVTLAWVIWVWATRAWATQAWIAWV